MVDFPTSPTSGQEFTLGNVTWTWDGVKWTAYPGALAIPDAPVDGQLYGRKNASWSLATGGGGIADAPTDGTAYARKSAAWAHLTHTDITDWTATLAPYALTTSVPAASSSSPLMDGTAAAGTGTTFARADHIHPTDTSRAAVTALPAAATVAPLPDGNAAVGVSAAYARADHVHPAVQIGDNRIINGDMRIDQRNNGASGTANNYTVDRWAYSGTAASKGTWGQRLNTVLSAAATGGFPYYLGFQSSSAYATPTGEAYQLRTALEGDAISDFLWGLAGSQPVTLLFWAYSSLTGTFSGSIRDYGVTRSYPFTYSLPTANTWTKIAIVIPGDAAGSWVLSGNAGALYLTFDLGSGTTFRGPANAWAAGNYVGATGSVSVVGTNGAQFFVTGVKLEIGSVATPFNRQSLAKSMADCQRYYQAQYAQVGAAYSTAGQSQSSSYIIQAMRAPPTVTFGTISYINSSGISGGASTPSVVFANVIVTATGVCQATGPMLLSAEL